MAYSLVLAADAEDDLLGIFDFLFEAHQTFGLSAEDAFDKAEARVFAIRRHLDGLCVKPNRGTLHDDMLEGLRNVTLERAIIWFDVEEVQRRVRVLAVFWDGEDHRRRMLLRLME